MVNAFTLGIFVQVSIETCCRHIQTIQYEFMAFPSDSNMLRFLWWNDGDFRLDPYALSMCMDLFVASFSP